MERTHFFLLILALCFLAACSEPREDQRQPALAPAPETLRSTTEGEVIGYVEEGERFAWLGIPYAEPPVGDLRWRAPRPPSPRQGTREMLAFANYCPQLGGVGSGVDEALYGQLVGDEDCLYLNIWAPLSLDTAAIERGKKLPVMVWIHGGGNSIGTANTYSYAGNLATTQEVVVVTINYRLGLLGWFNYPRLNTGEEAPALALADRSGNYGTLDIIQSLRWLQKNIAAFGGDPGNITLFGESAGGFNVYSMMLSPLAEGLFHKAISQSGGIRGDSLAESRNYRDELPPGHKNSSGEVLVALVLAEGLATNRDEAKAWLRQTSDSALQEWLRARPLDALFDILKDSQRGMGMVDVPQLLFDGYVLPARPVSELYRDLPLANPVPLITGTNRDEMKTFMMANPEYVRYWFGKIPRLRDAPAYDRMAAYLSDLWRVVGADRPARLISSQQDSPPVYIYRFDYDQLLDNWLVSMSDLIGAGHGMEIAYPFAVPATGSTSLSVHPEETLDTRRQLAHIFSSYWANFAYTGFPGRGRQGDLPEWQPWTGLPGQPKLMIIDAGEGTSVRMVDDELTVAGIKDRLVNDPAVRDNQQLLCETYARVFYKSMFGSWLYDPQEYANLGSGGCANYPLE